MARSCVHGIALASAVAGAIACTRPPLSTRDAGSGGPGGAPAVGTTGGSSGGASASTGVGGGQSCGRYVVPSPTSAVDVLILMDKSGSMADDLSGTACSTGCRGRSKWELTAAAIETIVSQTSATVNWGLKWFPDPNGGLCGVNAGLAVPVGPDNAPVLTSAIDRQTPGGSTPAQAAESAAAAYLAGLTDDYRKVILLATDGASNCMPGNSDTIADDTPAAIDAIASAAEQGFPTLVLGVAAVGGPADPALDQMAAAGGLARAGAHGYHPLSDTSALIATLEGLPTTAPGSCVFSVPVPPTTDGTTTRPPFAISVDGVPVPFDTTHTNGWDYTAPTRTSVQLYGPPCETVLNDPPTHTISIDFYCPGD